MGERILDTDYWLSIRSDKTGVTGAGKGQCKDWCRDVLEIDEIASNFTHQVAELGTIQIDQYATSILVHHWLEMDDFIADGTAGQFESEYENGYYGPFDKAPDKLKVVYSKKK
jgi:hypothetical protein